MDAAPPRPGGPASHAPGHGDTETGAPEPSPARHRAAGAPAPRSTETLDDMVLTALDVLARRHGDCELEDLAGYGFDEIALAAHGTHAIAEARRRRLDDRVAKASAADPAPAPPVFP
jgi:hypothetical protein